MRLFHSGYSSRKPRVEIVENNRRALIRGAAVAAEAHDAVDEMIATGEARNLRSAFGIFRGEAIGAHITPKVLNSKCMSTFERGERQCATGTTFRYRRPARGPALFAAPTYLGRFA